MTSSPARRLILAYAAITAVVYLYLLIPGDSWSTDGRQAPIWLALYGFVVWRFWQGSAGAWLFLLCLDVLTIVSFILIGVDLELGSVLILASAVAHPMILVSGPVRAHVEARPRPRTTSS